MDQLDHQLDIIRSLEEKQAGGMTCYKLACKYIARLGMTEVEAYQKMGIKRQRWSDFRTKDKLPHNDLLRLCLVLQLDINLTYYLMAFAKDTLYIYEITDAIVKECIRQKIYEPAEVNRMFTQRGLEGLFKDDGIKE